MVGQRVCMYETVSGLIPGLCPANKRRRYFVCVYVHIYVKWRRSCPCHLLPLALQNDINCKGPNIFNTLLMGGNNWRVSGAVILNLLKTSITMGNYNQVNDIKYFGIFGKHCSIQCFIGCVYLFWNLMLWVRHALSDPAQLVSHICFFKTRTPLSPTTFSAFIVKLCCVDVRN